MLNVVMKLVEFLGVQQELESHKKKQPITLPTTLAHRSRSQRKQKVTQYRKHNINYQKYGVS